MGAPPPKDILDRMVNHGLSRHLSGAGFTEFELRMPRSGDRRNSLVGHGQSGACPDLATAVSPDFVGEAAGAADDDTISPNGLWAVSELFVLWSRPSPDESAGACQVPDQLLSQRWPASGKSGVTSGSAVALRYSTPSALRS